MPHFIDLTGQKFGRLTVVRRHFKKKVKKTYWECLCSCGKTTTVRADSLKKGHTKSCGCYKTDNLKKAKTTHGMWGRRVYRVWNGMKERCLNPNNPAYNYYGGRGITVCRQWLKFKTFFKDMGNPPQGMTIERKDNNKGYCKYNCIWATRKDQSNNMRSNRILEYNGKSATISQWAELLSISHYIIRGRLSRGWGTKRTFETPTGVYQKCQK